MHKIINCDAQERRLFLFKPQARVACNYKNFNYSIILSLVSSEPKHLYLLL